MADSATIATIQRIVCRVWRVDESVMTTPLLSPHFAQARQAAMHMARKHGCREVDVAAAFGRHKDTVSHAVRAVNNRLPTDAAFRLLYEEAAAAARRALLPDVRGAATGGGMTDTIGWAIAVALWVGVMAAGRVL